MLRRAAKRLGLLKPKEIATRNTMASGLRCLAAIGVEPTLILDVGASDGRWTDLARSIFPNARFALFEPQPVHAVALDAFAAAHPRDVVIRQAVGAKTGTTFFDVSDPFGGALSAEGAPNSIEVRMTTIDASSTADPSDRVLIKLDTHGFERSILDGAAKTLSQTCALIIEAYGYRITPECMLFWELCAYLSERGFRPVDIVDMLHRPIDDTFWQADIIFVRSDWPGFAITSYGP